MPNYSELCRVVPSFEKLSTWAWMRLRCGGGWYEPRCLYRKTLEWEGDGADIGLQLFAIILIYAIKRLERRNHDDTNRGARMGAKTLAMHQLRRTTNKDFLKIMSPRDDLLLDWVVFALLRRTRVFY